VKALEAQALKLSWHDGLLGAILPSVSTEPNMNAAAELAAERVGVPAAFLNSLSNETNHWSLVIKAAAIVEGALSDLLERKLDVSVPANIARELGAKYTRDWLLALGAIDKATADICQAIAELRNKLAHGPTRVAGFTLQGYRDELDANQQKSFLHRLAFKESGAGAASTAMGDALWKDGHPLLIWLPLISVLAFVQLEHEMIELQKDKLALKERTTEELLSWVSRLAQIAVPAAIAGTATQGES
jgi:hypothetical protein